MRRCNVVLGVSMLVLMIVHIVAGAFQMMGILPGGLAWMKFLSYLLMADIVVHSIIGVILTIDTLKAQKKAGVSYPGANKLFWTRRISGFVMLILIAFHLYIFTSLDGEVLRLKTFALPQLIVSILLAVSILVHIISNIRPLFIGIGKKRYMDLIVDFVFVLAIVALLGAAAFFVYYYRWNLIWKV